jgi:hypothetical protein
MDLLPAELNRLIALGCLAGIAMYFVWLVTGKERRQLGQNGWKVVLPSAKLTLVQVLIGVVDLGFCAMAMYLLVPMQPHIDFMSLAVVFILATLLGFASHAPGSLGVFDAAMLVALPQYGREQLLATLLVFRLLYFVIPFMISISIMGTREMWLSVVVPLEGPPQDERKRERQRPLRAGRSPEYVPGRIRADPAAHGQARASRRHCQRAAVQALQVAGVKPRGFSRYVGTGVLLLFLPQL